MTKNNMTHEQDTRSALEHFTMDFSAIQMTYYYYYYANSFRREAISVLCLQ